MIVQTAFLSCSPDKADALGAALARVAAVSLKQEPGTVDYVVLRAATGDETILFTTIEWFSSRAAMEAHNTSAAVAEFFERATPLLADAPRVTVNTVVPPMRL